MPPLGLRTTPHAIEIVTRWLHRLELKGFEDRASPEFGRMLYCLVVEGFRVTNIMRFVLLWWISKLPSRVGLMCLTIPA